MCRIIPLSLALALVLALPKPSAAQYMYLDANGDGVHTAADVVAPTGTTDVDVWLVTDQNRDGSPAVCSTHDGKFTINSYEVLLDAAAGGLAWGTFTNHVSSFTTYSIVRSSDTEFYAAFLSGTPLPPGRYHLGTLPVTRASGSPSLIFRNWSTVDRIFAETAFGCMCSGQDQDNTLKFGTDWLDADGLAYGGINHPPTLASIPDMDLTEGGVLTQEVSANDPDGGSVFFFKGLGPAFITVTTLNSSVPATGLVRAAPGFADNGTYLAWVRASDGVAQDSGSVRIQVEDVNQPPLLSLSPGSHICLERGFPTLWVVSAADPDLDSLRFTFSGLPTWAHITAAARSSISITFAPADSTPLGSTFFTVTVSDGVLGQSVPFEAFLADECNYGGGGIFASGSNPPVAAAGGPYASVAGERITLDASASSDPDGDAVTCSWNFGDGSSALGSRVVHDYEAAGAYRAVVRATSLGGADRDTAVVQVSPPLAARAFTANGSQVVPVRAKRRDICARLQAVGGNFELTGLLPGSFRLRSEGTGEISEIGSTPSKAGTVADSDHDGVSEVEECFASQDLARLFSSLRGRSSVDCILAARLVSGAKVEAPLTLTVVALPAKLQAAVSPNPLNPNGVLRIDLTRASAVTVRLFDASGRLVRKIGRPQMAEGPHVVEIDGRDDHGRPLASGVYFYKVATLEGTTTGRFAVLK